VLGEFAFTPAFSLPIWLFLEAKFTRTSCRLPVVRSAHRVIHDINENFVQSGKSRARRRYQYAYALFSASGFTREAQDFALAHQISSSTCPVRRSPGCATRSRPPLKPSPTWATSTGSPGFRSPADKELPARLDNDTGSSTTRSYLSGRSRAVARSGCGRDRTPCINLRQVRP
jgi:hypothetical protein